MIILTMNYQNIGDRNSKSPMHSYAAVETLMGSLPWTPYMQAFELIRP